MTLWEGGISIKTYKPCNYQGKKTPGRENSKHESLEAEECYKSEEQLRGQNDQSKENKEAQGR